MRLHGNFPREICVYEFVESQRPKLIAWQLDTDESVSRLHPLWGRNSHPPAESLSSCIELYQEGIGKTMIGEGLLASDEFTILDNVRMPWGTILYLRTGSGERLIIVVLNVSVELRRLYLLFLGF